MTLDVRAPPTPTNTTFDAMMSMGRTQTPRVPAAQDEGNRRVQQHWQTVDALTKRKSVIAKGLGKPGVADDMPTSEPAITTN